MLAAPTLADESQVVGKRPCELVWANRNEDDHPPLADFEDLSGGQVVGEDAQAALERTRKQQIWGKYVGKLSYRGSGRSPEVRIKPPQPLRIPTPLDVVTLWIYGNNWGFASDPNTPPVNISALFADAHGKEFRAPLGRVDWTEWSLLHRGLTPEQIAAVRPGASLTGILITGAGTRKTGFSTSTTWPFSPRSSSR